VSVIEGTYAFVLISPAYFPDEVVATCKGSPLIFCETETKQHIYFTSDQVTLPPNNKYMYAKNGDIIHIQNDGTYEINEQIMHTSVKETEPSAVQEHFMLQEIIEQPNAIRNMFRGRICGETVKLGGIQGNFLKDAKTLILIGCGSSYNACLVARPFLEKYTSDKSIHVELASDFVLRRPCIHKTTAYIVISQSGETRDCIAACEYISEECSGTCFGINNRPGSLLDSNTCGGMHLNIGTEKSVPATKSFTATIIALMMMISPIEFSKIPDILETHIQRTIHGSLLKKLVSKCLEGEGDMWMVGDSWGLGVAKEFTLKLQEVAYIKAIASTGYEMKHGPIALIDEKSHVFYFGPCGTQIPTILESRCAKIIHSSEHNSFTRMLCDVVTMQLVTYYTALSKNLPIDTPKNLAKSVTV
jgi:glucosamine--fructose-6-phosphate aminotransferase (isomerizing)